MKAICYKDTELLARLPVGKWIAAGAYGIHGSRMNRLVRLGLLERRFAPAEMSRSWDYRRAR